MDLQKLIRDIPDFPKKGIIFKDITTLLKNPAGLNDAAEQILALVKDLGITKVAGIESRGFILGGLLAARLQAGFIPIRKPKKLPAPVYSESYDLEYGTDTIEMHKDAITAGDIVLLHDDLLATGGTAKAACNIIEKAGGKIVHISFIIELAFLHGKDKLQGYEISSLIKYDGE
ncbi:MAG: adenine phosphoribosyltransferase [Ignavibacteriales bacterium]|nr:adenine phosphoribosyltransferase [Ignavibacteriales bacterium]